MLHFDKYLRIKDYIYKQSTYQLYQISPSVLTHFELQYMYGGLDHHVLDALLTGQDLEAPLDESFPNQPIAKHPYKEVYHAALLRLSADLFL